MRRRYAAAAAGLCALAVAGIIVLLVADAADAYLLPINLGYTAGALLVFSLTAAAALTAVGRYPLAWIGWLGVLLSIAGFGFFMPALWEPSLGEEGGNLGLLKAAASLWLFSLALAHVSLVLTRLRTDDGPLVRAAVTGALLFVLVLATLLTVAVVDDVSDELYFRVTAVVAVLSALGTALIPVLRAGRRAA